MADKTFYVDSSKDSWCSSDRFETYEQAEAYARSKAWRDAKGMYIFQAVAEVAAPVEVNTVQVTKL